MPIMSHDRWMERTYIGMTSIRSDTMKAVDKALASYHLMRNQESLRKLYVALNRWIESKGTNWKASDRNKNHAIENLYDQVYDELFGTAARRAAQRPNAELRQTLETARIEASKRLFANTRLEVKADHKRTGLKTTELGLTAWNMRGIYKGAKAVGMPDPVTETRNAIGLPSQSGDKGLARRMLEQIVRTNVEAPSVAEVLRFLHMTGAFTDYVAELAKSLIPMKGLITSGGGAIYNALLAARDSYRMFDIASHRQILIQGDASEACRAMMRIIDRQQDAHLRSAAISAVEFGTRAILTVVDPSQSSQAIAGGAVSLANLSHRIFLIGRDFVEKNRANKVLAKPEDIDLHIFSTHPILGCYLLCFSETSSLIYYLAEFGGPGWMDDVEWQVKTHLNPLRVRALDLLADSRFVLASQNKDQLERRFHVDKATKQKIKDTFSRSNAKKFSPMSATDFKKRYGRDLPSDFRQRIVGQGSSSS